MQQGFLELLASDSETTVRLKVLAHFSAGGEEGVRVACDG